MLTRRPCATAPGPALLTLLLAAALASPGCGDDGGGGTEDVPCTDPVLCPDLASDADAGDADEEVGECQTDGQCAEERYCDVESALCVLGCRLSPDTCEAACAACDAETRECAVDPVCANACSEDGECPTTRYCDLSGASPGQCRTGCRPDAPECPNPDLGFCCNDDEVCDPDSHLCRGEVCDADTDCPALQFCSIPAGDPLGAACRDGCRGAPDNCRTHFGGGPTTICDPDVHVCGPIDCGTDDERCPTAYVCELAACRPGCRNDESCSSGQPCDPVSRTCGCATDDDCDELTVCVGDSCRARCAANADCSGATPFCNDTSGRCFAGCPNEAGEPNNTTTTATTIGAATTLFGVLCGVDVDWFRTTGVAGETIRLTVAFDPGQITISTRSGASLGNVLVPPVTAESPTSIVEILIDVTTATAGPIGLGFTGRGAPSEGSDALTLGYVAQIERFPTASCQPDSREDDDTFAAAALAPIVEGSYPNLSLCAGDSGGDWFAFTLPPDQRATISLARDDDDADLVLDVRDESLDLLASDRAVGDDLFAAVGPFASGLATDLFVHVHGFGPADEVNRYTLALDFQPVAACVPDALEAGSGDDTALAATQSGAVIGAPATFSNLTACNGDADWFAVNAFAGGSITARVTQASAGRDLEIAILGSNGTTVLATRTDAQLDRSLSATGLPSTATYYLRITDVGGVDAGADGVTYSVTLDVQAPECTDTYEDDDAAVEGNPVAFTANVFDTAAGASPRACLADVDYWTFTLAGTTTVSADLTVAGPGDVRLELLALGGTETVVATGTVAGASLLRIAALALPPGSYAVRVSPTPGGFLPLAGRTYGLRITAVPDLVVCEDGGLDPGSTPEEAVVVATTRTDERVCADDEDYWRFSLTGPTALGVVITISDLPSCAPNAVAALFEVDDADPSVAEVTQALTSCSAALTWNFLDPGEGLLRIGDGGPPPVPASGFTYDFGLTRTPIQVCQPPTNGTSGTAASLQPGSVTSRLCTGGSAWYLVTLADQTRHTFSLSSSAAANLRLELSTFAAPGVPILGQTTDAAGNAAFATSVDVGLHFLHVSALGAVPQAGRQFTLDWATAPLTVCEADYLEPNDVPGAALLVGGVMDEPLTLCPADTDWFVVDIPNDDTDVTVTLRQLDLDRPLALRLYDGTGGVVGGLLDERVDANATKVLSLELDDLNPDDAFDYFVEVTEDGANPVLEGGARYALDVELGAAPCTDFLEPDDDDANATEILADEAITYANLLACGANPDVFAVDVVDGTTLTVTVDRFAPSTAMTVTVREPGGGVVDSVAGTAAQTQFALATGALGAGRHLVEVTAAAPPAAGERYTIRLDSVAPFVCSDAYEPNDTPGQATVLGVPLASVDARVCDAGAAGYDYYRIEPTLGPVSLAAQLSNPSGAPLVLTLRTAADAPLASGPSLDVPGLDAAPYLLRVESSDPGVRGAPYSLAVQTELFGCSVDVDEDNDAPSAGLPAPPGFGAFRVLCEGDDDYFRFTVPSGGPNVNVLISHDPTPFPVLVEILEADEDVVASLQDTLASKSLWFFGAPAGDYYVRLSHLVPGGEVAPEHGLTYQLAVNVTTDSVCAQDPQEPNDTPALAERLTTTLGGILCPADVDWFRLPLFSTVGDLDLELVFADGPTLTLGLYDPSGVSLIDSASSATSPLGLSVFDLPGADYRVRVVADTVPELGLTYQLTGTAIERGCLPDAFEPNESFDDASVPEAGGTPFFQFGASVCGTADRDFFALTSQGSLNVSVAPAPICPPEEPGCVEPPPAELAVVLYEPGRNPLPNPFDTNHAPGTFYAEVFTTSDPEDVPAQGQPYTFNWQTGPACADDAFETAGDDFADPVVGASLPSPANLVLCGDDVDVIRYTTPPGGPSDLRAQVLLGTANVGAVLELYLETDLVTPAAVDPGDFVPSLVARAAAVPAGTDVFVVLRKEPPSAVRVPYTLTVTLDGACADDANEPNESLATATALPADTAVPGTLCPGDLDFYTTALAAAGAFTAAVDTAGAVLNVDLFERVGETLESLAVTREVTPTGQRLTAALDHSATLVTLLSGSEAPVDYDLTLETGVCFGDAIDDLGSNETQGTAAPWLPQDGYALCPEGDEDWHSFVVNAPAPGAGQTVDGFYVRVGAVVGDAEAVYDLELRDGTDVLQSIDETSPEAGGVVLTPVTYLENGTYFVRVRSARVPFLPFAYDVVVLESASAP